MRASVAAYTLEPLAWDTKHFGFRMGQVSFQRDPVAFTASAPAQAAVEEARQQRFHALVARAHPHDIGLIHALEEAGFRLVDTLVSFQLDLIAHPPTPAQFSHVRVAREADVEPLMALARRAFADRSVWLDRFHADPHIPAERANELYALWVKNSVAPEKPEESMADVTLVSDCPEGISGFITCRIFHVEGKKQGTVSLNAVDMRFRQRGVYRDLVHAALLWFQSQGCSKIQVRTNIASHGVRRTWKSFHAVPSTEEHTFHWWA